MEKYNTYKVHKAIILWMKMIQSSCEYLPNQSRLRITVYGFILIVFLQYRTVKRICRCSSNGNNTAGNNENDEYPQHFGVVYLYGATN